ncbi:hypothetical protein WICMUC_005344 [Wickerhamomyces mucosus]|uniref:Uncharacterized protein n=1 Tax=Wickerhamomyces mucosus TaxID=1378264 RepID=A0A9P8P823_9ASCO|nr:hypothetical protein WICMUC_005344 [Wickerhamomyces mucosus]
MNDSVQQDFDEVFDLDLTISLDDSGFGDLTTFAFGVLLEDEVDCGLIVFGVVDLAIAAQLCLTGSILGDSEVWRFFAVPSAFTSDG